MADEVYAQLTAPFEKTFERNGFTFVTMQQVTSRLNEVLGVGNWSFTIKEHGYSQQADSYWALGRLETYIDKSLVVREQFGAQQVNRYRAPAPPPGQPPAKGGIIDVGNDMKGAATDAFKKCASSLGVGLYLSGTDS